MLTCILQSCGKNPGFMIGAEIPGERSASAGEGDDIFVTEADESDGTHKLLAPWLGVVPNVDGDHSWSVGGESALRENFRTFASRSGELLCFSSDKEFFAGSCKKITTLQMPGSDFTFAGFCGFMAVNARIAVEAAVLLGCDRSAAESAVSAFKGIKRRMTLHIQDGERTVIEDYAHHPNEVKNAIRYLRIQYPGHHLRVVFQPHRYARLERFYPDFVRELKQADSLFTVPVFAAWSESGSCNSQMLADCCGGISLTGSWEENAGAIRGLPHGDKPLLIAVLGAGDVEKIIPYL